MDNLKVLRFAIKATYPVILKKFTTEELLVFRNCKWIDIICPPKIREWIRNELLSIGSPLLYAFVECGFADRDKMTQRILEDFKIYVDHLCTVTEKNGIINNFPQTADNTNH